MAEHGMLPGRRLMIAVASGKGGTGKTLVATNLAVATARAGVPTVLVDCDVEAPNDALFLTPDTLDSRAVTFPLATVNQAACTSCGKCRDACAYGAIRVLGDTVVVFAELCHGCGLCTTVCPTAAITEVPQRIGEVEWGAVPIGIADPGGVKMVTGRLEIGDVKATSVIRAARRQADVFSRNITILDASPGVACSAVAATHGVDMLVLVTEPTPFGLHDLDLAVRLGRDLRIPMGVVINRDGAGSADLDAYLADAGVPVLARIPFDRSIAETYADGGLVLDSHPDAPGWFGAIWDGIAQLTVEAQ
ncbi:MAG: (4Fe-4S)-binding protein [Actinobacteria bacterium HGW-Actinobacteria-6]|jgi:MinD superfamily P-loop ATPase|nr:MAG: (4Fe-4S)-binding protein [Actinobacteria bacterium HGW-Actinobacteria-6]